MDTANLLLSMLGLDTRYRDRKFSDRESKNVGDQRGRFFIPNDIKGLPSFQDEVKTRQWYEDEPGYESDDAPSRQWRPAVRLGNKYYTGDTDAVGYELSRYLGLRK